MADAPTRQFLTFRVGGDLYALPAKGVAEVIRMPPVARLPQSPIEARYAVAQLGREGGHGQKLLRSARSGRTSRFRLIAGHPHLNPYRSCRPEGAGRSPRVLSRDRRAGSVTPGHLLA